MLLTTISEIVIYILLFRFMYLHDNTERLRALLEPQVIRKRNKNNAITFFGQFCSFLFEVSVWMIFTFAMLVGKGSVLLLALVSILRTIFFTCMTIVEVMTSSPLRSFLYEKLQRCWNLCQSCHCQIFISEFNLHIFMWNKVFYISFSFFLYSFFLNYTYVSY